MVHASGVTAGKGRGDAWTVRFALEPWKLDGGELQSDKLPIYQSIDRSDLRAFMKRTRPHEVLRVRIRPHEELDAAELLFVVTVGEADEELAAHAAQMQQPVTAQDDFFGTFVQEEQPGWYRTSARWGLTPVHFYAHVGNDGTLATALLIAKKLWLEQSAWDKRIRSYAAQRMLGLKNESWLGEGERPLKASEFMSRLTAGSVLVGASGKFKFSFDDGNMFQGNAIQVTGSIAEGLNDAGLLG
ncbi:MAG: DUF2262 domain-containing protein [Acidobacteriota bacterium]